VSQKKKIAVISSRLVSLLIIFGAKNDLLIFV